MGRFSTFAFPGLSNPYPRSYTREVQRGRLSHSKAEGQVLWFADEEGQGFAMYVAAVRARKVYAPQVVVFARMNIDDGPWDMEGADAESQVCWSLGEGHSRCAIFCFAQNRSLALAPSSQGVWSEVLAVSERVQLVAM